MSTENKITPESLSTEYLSPESCSFSINPNGFTAAVINGTEYRRVVLTRALPLTGIDSFVCVTDVEGKELGIIEKISAFPEASQKVINAELDRRYYCPTVTKIISIKEKMGHFYFDVMIGDFKKSFTVKDITKNIRSHGSGFDLIDVDGNRYRIVNFEEMPSKSRRCIEPYIY